MKVIVGGEEYECVSDHTYVDPPIGRRCDYCSGEATRQSVNTGHILCEVCIGGYTAAEINQIKTEYYIRTALEYLGGDQLNDNSRAVLLALGKEIDAARKNSK